MRRPSMEEMKSCTCQRSEEGRAKTGKQKGVEHGRIELAKGREGERLLITRQIPEEERKKQKEKERKKETHIGNQQLLASREQRARRASTTRHVSKERALPSLVIFHSDNLAIGLLEAREDDREIYRMSSHL